MIHTGARTEQEALDDRRSLKEELVETEIIVHPKKSRRKNIITHKLAHLEKDHPNIWFVAAIDSNSFQRMCEDSDYSWRQIKAGIRNEIRSTSRGETDFKIESVPQKLRDRIVVAQSGCWLWKQARWRNKRGSLKANNRIFPTRYGRVRFGGRQWAAHRLIYTRLAGEIPKGALLRHSCDTPACVNPLHLELGITEDNVRDMIDRGRAGWQRHRSGKKK
jgi:hypothetical protein